MAEDREESLGGVADSQRSSPRKRAERREGVGEGMEAGCRSRGRCGIQEDVLGLTSGVAVDVRPPRGVHASISQRLSKLNRSIQSPSTVTETQTWPTFYSRFTRWFLLAFIPMDRATRVLQVCLKDQSLVWPRIQTTKLPSTLPRICKTQT